MKSLVIVFPGLGYTADKPLLYYGLNIARECNYESYRKLSFIPQGNANIRGNEAAMKAAFDELYKQAGISIKVFKNCNHSLEVADDTNGNINRILEIMKITKDFISKS